MTSEQSIRIEELTREIEKIGKEIGGDCWLEMREPVAQIYGIIIKYTLNAKMRELGTEEGMTDEQIETALSKMGPVKSYPENL